jgi:glyoxylase-like metal-dependent hydrolase (beta-lactamase superfamily II)
MNLKNENYPNESIIQKSFVTSMPDKAGAFLRASEIIAEYQGNMVRASYNKAVDLHMLFIDVEASPDNLQKIEKALCCIGYINKKIGQARVMEVTIKIPDQPGCIIPVLKILDRYDINISYINSNATGGSYQNFKLGLFIENPSIIKTLLDEISEVYQIDIIDCDSSEENLDNTVFYIQLANQMQKLFDLSEEKTMQFISESNRILQELQTDGEDARKVFDYIRRFANFVSANRGDQFKVDIQKLQLSDTVTLYSIQPYCGSNTYVFDTPSGLVLIDSGYAIYANEMLKVLNHLFPDWETRSKRIYITHADVDHCGLLSKFKDAEIFVNQKSAASLLRQAQGLPDYRENTPLRFGYSKISRIISGYVPPDANKLKILDIGTPDSHDALIQIGSLNIEDLEFLIFEGSGGHLFGEMVYACKKAGVVFTGDILVNVNGFSRERSEFNSLAPYLMKSVNIDSKKATEMRKQITALIEDISLFDKTKGFLQPEDYTEGIFGEVAGQVYGQYEKDRSVNPAKIISYFESKEDQSEAAALFSAEIRGDMDEAGRRKAITDTIMKLKESSLDRQSQKAIEMNDTELLMKIIAKKTELKKLRFTLDESHP